jgi:hypothetical protein
MEKLAIEPGFCQCGCGGKTKIATTQNNARMGWIKGQPMRFLPGHRARVRFLPFKETREFARALGLKSTAEWQT